MFTKTRILYRLLTTLAVAFFLFTVCGSPAAAVNIADYFTISYSVEFSTTETVSEAYVTGRIIAEHEDSGAEVMLNPGYTLSISPFPNTVGETVEASQTVTLRFPEESLPGSYHISGEVIEAKVKVVLWFNVTSYLPQLQSMGTVNYMPPEPEDDEPDSPEQPFTGTTYTEGSINQQGTITQTTIAPSMDNNCIITLEEGIKALDKYDQPLERISISELEEPLPPPEYCRFTSPIYNIEPDGATFEPPAVITIFYDEFQIPTGVSEDMLTIATWDETSEQWIELEDCVVNAVENTITASISHFTAFTILAHNAPAAFSVSGLSISPAEVDTDGNVTISIMVNNSGDLAGSYEVTLIIDNKVEETRVVTLEGQSSKEVIFTASRSDPGLYLLRVNDVPGSFTILESVVVEDTEDRPAALVKIEESASSPGTTGTTSWWLISGIFTACAILLVIIALWLVRRRSKARQTEKEQIILQI
jgi:hypothetical protein